MARTATTRFCHVLSALIITCACLCQPCIAQQTKPDLFLRIEQVFKRDEPRWKVDRILGGETFDPLHESITFRNGKQQASIDISVWRRLEDARQVFAGHAIVLDKTWGATIKTSLPNLGDENYIRLHKGSNAWPMIDFRKQTILVSVYAPNVATAERFARRIAKQIDLFP